MVLKEGEWGLWNGKEHGHPHGLHPSPTSMSCFWPSLHLGGASSSKLGVWRCVSKLVAIRNDWGDVRGFFLRNPAGLWLHQSGVSCSKFAMCRKATDTDIRFLDLIQVTSAHLQAISVDDVASLTHEDSFLIAKLGFGDGRHLRNDLKVRFRTGTIAQW